MKTKSKVIKAKKTPYSPMTTYLNGLRDMLARQSEPQSPLDTFLDGLDAGTDGRGYGEEHEKARLLLEAAPDMLKALHEVLAIGEGGVIETRETGKPTWHALDAVKTIASKAIAKVQGDFEHNTGKPFRKPY